MKEIGRFLACVLLAVTISKNVLATSAANIKFSKGRSNEIAQSDVTRPESVSKPPPNTDVEFPGRSFPDGMYKSENDEDTGLEKPRTFGAMKRLQFMLMPMFYKMGVMMTMLMVLTVVSVKGLFVGIILLVLKLSTFLAKIHSGWHGSHSQQPIHVHVHNSHLPHIHPQIYHGWEMASPGDDDHYYYKG